MSIRFLQLLICLSVTFPGLAQVFDDFSDGDFLNDPTWSGDQADFEIDPNGELHLLTTVAGKSHLVIGNTLFDKVAWEFTAKLDFNPSSSNLAKIYLMSDQADLEGSLNGYYLMIGDTQDEISLYKQEGLTSTYIINGADGIVAGAPKVRIKVIRDQTGRWSLYQDLNGGNNYEFVGSEVDLDPDITSTGYFGFLCEYTVTRADKFYFDDIGIDQLRVDTILVIDNTTVEVRFNQYLRPSEIANTSGFSIDGLSIAESNAVVGDSSRVLLSLDPVTPLDTRNYSLQVGASLTLNDIEEAAFSYEQLTIDTVLTLSASEVLVDFNSELDKITAEDVLHYEIDQGIGTPISAVINPSDASQVILTLPAAFSDGNDYEIAASGISNSILNSNFSGSASFTFIVPLLIQSVEVLSPDSLYVKFNKALDPVSIVPANFLVHGIGIPITSTVVDGSSIYLVFPENFTEATYHLEVSNLRDQEGFEIEAGSSLFFSYLPLKILSVSQTDQETIEIFYNQNVEEASGTKAEHYYVPEFGFPESATISAENNSIVQLTFPQLINSRYQMVVQSIENSTKNSIIYKDTLEFDFEKPTGFRSIQINEIMADFSPSVGLPEAEYVEIYNPGSYPVTLQDFLLNGEPIPSFALPVNGYVVLTDDSNTGLFEPASTVYLSSFDALTNLADSVILRDQFGNLVDSVFYTLDWYRNSEKDDGGYALEQINATLACSDETNWMASSHLSGGTPGEINSIASNEPDDQGPILSEAEIISGDTVVVLFNEPVALDLDLIQNLTISNRQITQIHRQSYRHFEIIPDQSLSSETWHTIIANDISDCQGNTTLIDSLSFYYDTTPPIFRELVIVSENEIALTFHEPLKESIAETEENFNVNGMFPSKATLQDSASNRVQIVFNEDFLVGADYQVAVSNLTDTLGNKMDPQEINFQFLDQVDTVLVVAPNLINVRFTEVPKGPLKGSSFLVSGNIGNPSAIEVDGDDPKLIHLGFDKNLTANTAYQLYIKDLYSDDTSEKLMTPARTMMYDTRAPRINQLLIPADSQLVIVWDEPIKLITAFSAIQYLLEGYGYPTDLEALDQRQMKLTFDFELPQEENLTLKVTGIEDLYGNKAGTLSRSFVYDQRPPRITSVKVLDVGSLKVAVSEKLDTSTVYRLDHFALEGISPTSIQVVGPDSLSIGLGFPSIPQNLQTTLSIRGLIDKYGNGMDSVAIYFNSLNPVVSHVSFPSDSVVEVNFSKEMSTSLFSLSNYTVATNLVLNINSISSSKVELVLSDKLSDGDSVHLEIQNLTDQFGNALIEKKSSSKFNTYFLGWKLIDLKTLELIFDTKFHGLSQDLFTVNSLNPALLQIDGNNRGIIRMVFADPLPTNQTIHLYWTNLLDIYGRRIPDRMMELSIDRKPPTLISIESDYRGQINLLFDEDLSPNSLSPNHFKLLENVGLQLIHSISANSISLVFDELRNGENYQLIISGISDKSGNFIKTDTIAFSYQAPFLPQNRDVIITELMADPTPSVGLPELEYVELFNASDDVIRLSSLLFSDAGKSVALPAFDFLPGTFLVLSAVKFENGVTVPGFPTLDNTGDSLTIMNLEGEIIDQVVYSREWYGDTEKDDGGYSLELINPESECPGIINWAASTDVNGGTPGFVNSIYSLSPDSEPPVLLNYQVHDSSVQLNFSEPLDSLSILEGAYLMDGLSMTLSEVSTNYSDQIMISFDTQLQPGKLYQLEVFGPVDCSGNELVPFSISFGLGAKPEFNDLIITEIMADPDPVLGLPNSEYLEIHNRTDKLISLDNVKIMDEGGEMKLPAIVIPAHDYLVLVPSNAVSQFENEVTGVPNWRSLNNSGELLAIFHGEELIFNVDYSSSWHTIENDGGISLEIRDVNNPCAGSVNWGSSLSQAGGTPGAANSIAESIPDNFGPELVEVNVLSDAALRLVFDEPLLFDEISISQLEILPGPIQISDIKLDTLVRDFLLVHLLDRLSPGTTYTITLSQLKDCNGNLISANTLEFILPEEADSLDVIINEVLFNPREDGVDFVEVYNRSSKNIDLNGWQLGRKYEDRVEEYIISSGHHILWPGQYLALTTNKMRLVEDYPLGRSDDMIEMNAFPVLPNESASILLIDDEDQIMDAFEYHEDMHLSLLESVDGVSLERISFDQPTQDPNNWQSASSTVGFATPGYQNSQSMEVAPKGVLTIEPKVFVPANFGSTITPDFTTINYQLTSTGQLANVNIYNRNGQLIKNLASGISLASNGFLRWDGTTDGGSVASMGYYLIVFELYDGTGHREIMKETVVVGR